MELYQLCLISEIGLVVHLSSVLLFVLGPFMSVYALVVLFVF